MDAKSAVAAAGCLVQVTLVSGLWVLLASFASTMAEFEGKSPMSDAWIFGPVIAGALVTVLFIAGFSNPKIRARLGTLWRLSTFGVGILSVVVFAGSAVFVAGLFVAGAGADGWAVFLGLLVSSFATLVGMADPRTKSGAEGPVQSNSRMLI